MKGKNIAYWITTGLVAAAYIFGGIVDIGRGPQVVDGMKHLGYPVYVALILGIWKVLAALAIVAPRLPLLKEWAYAGMFFNLTGAAASHAFSGDTAGNIITPLVLLLLVMASWALRPPSRRLCPMEPAGAAMRGAEPKAGS